MFVGRELKSNILIVLIVFCIVAIRLLTTTRDNNSLVYSLYSNSYKLY